MKKLFLFSFFIFSFSFSRAQWVTIPDPNFVAWLTAYYPACMSGNQMDTTSSAILAPYTQIDCSSHNINNLYGVQFFDDLYQLICNNNPLTSIPILHSPSLITLNCNDCQLTSLPSITTLSTLACSNNFISSFPVGMFTTYNNLVYLECSNNFISGTLHLPVVNYLQCDHNQISNLIVDEVIMNPSSPYIICNDNQLTNLSIPFYVTGGTHYSGIDCHNNSNLDCLPPFNVCTNLNFTNTAIDCLPFYPSFTTSIPLLTSLPLCDIFYNPNNCPLLSSIIGTVFNGFNNNCIYDAGEHLLNHEGVSIYQGGNFIGKTYSNSSGVYNFVLNGSGNYDLIPDTNSTLHFSCPSTGIYNITTIGGTTTNVPGFELECDSSGFDLGTTGINHGAFGPPGQLVLIHMLTGDQSGVLNGVNCNTVGLSGQVEVIITGQVSFAGMVAGGLTPASISGDTIIWNINDFSTSNLSNLLNFYIQVDTLAQLGTPVCFDIEVTPVIGDTNPVNNSFVACGPIISSMDPNFKEVSPTTTLQPSYDGWLTYTIHFQNTGTAPAAHIKILDTLDTNLDPSTFQYLSSSHNPLVAVSGSVSVFDFQNINLPDSATNQQTSQGWVMYRIKLNQGIPLGTIIQNTASIYFDYNSPIVTNTVNNLICNPIVPVNISESICIGDFYDFNGTNISVAGNYSDTTNAINGCDSVINLSLTVLSPISNSISQAICDGDVFNFNGQQLSATGIYFDTLNAINGCDSIVNLNLTVLNPSSSSLNQNICFGDIFNFNAANLSSSGIYFDTLSAVNTCDSIITLNLTVENINATIQQSNDTLTATGNGTVQWYDCNTQQIIAGATQTVFVPTESGIYAAIITSNNCVDTSACVQVYTGVNELTIYHSQFTIYPNPTDDEVTISLSQPCSDCTIQITNTLGQLLFNQSINNLKLSSTHKCNLKQKLKKL